jgi:hypothetical protein
MVRLKPHVFKALLLYNHHQTNTYNPGHEGLFRPAEAGVVLFFTQREERVPCVHSIARNVIPGFLGVG